MKKRNYLQNKSAQNVKRERDPIPWRYCLLTLICGLFLVVGFFFAARQHFAAIEFGIKNSRLRKQLDDLEDEKRRLLLAKEFAISPAEIKKAAKKFGLSEITENVSLFGGQTAKNDANSSVKPAKQTDDNLPSADKDVQSFTGKPSKTENVAAKTAMKTPKEVKTVKADKDFKTTSRATDKKGQNVR